MNVATLRSAIQYLPGDWPVRTLVVNPTGPDHGYHERYDVCEITKIDVAKFPEDGGPGVYLFEDA